MHSPQVYANEAGGEVLVVDQWPDADSFLRFFEEGTDIGEMMGEAGVTERPTPVFWRELDTPDKFYIDAARAGCRRRAMSPWARRA